MSPYFSKIIDLIGHTPILRVHSLSEITGCHILVKCENRNPGGSIKDRAALNMILEAIEKKELTPDKTIVEGTAGNTGIGLAYVSRALGLKTLVVMPKGQTLEKQNLIELYGAKLKLVEPAPFKSQDHFYHTAARLANEDPKKYWWANQFENLSNFRAHFQGTGPEIEKQLGDQLDYLVSVAGTGGTIGGTSQYLKKKNKKLKVRLVDPKGSGLAHFVNHGEFKSEGSSITEGIGVSRLVANFSEAQVDDAISLDDKDLVTIAYHLKKTDGLIVGSSSALNILGAFYTALKEGPGKTILTFLCDNGERSYSKLYNSEFLKSKGIEIVNDLSPMRERFVSQ